MQVWFWIWIGVLVASIVIEACTLDLISGWFAVGALIPLILSACNVGWEIQVVVFVIVSAVSMISLRKVAIKYLFKNSNSKTNVDALVGKTVRMLTETDFDTVGTVKVNDVVWSAVGVNQETIEKGQLVEVVAIEGNKLKVKQIQDKNKEKSNKE